VTHFPSHHGTGEISKEALKAVKPPPKPPRVKVPSKKERRKAAENEKALDVAIRRELKGLGEAANAAAATF